MRLLVATLMLAYTPRLDVYMQPVNWPDPKFFCHCMTYQSEWKPYRTMKIEP